MTITYSQNGPGSKLGLERDIKLHNWSIAQCGTDDSASLNSCIDTKLNELLVSANTTVKSKIISGELAPYGSMTSEEFLDLELLRATPDARLLYESYVFQETGTLFDADSDLFNARPISVNDAQIDSSELPGLPLP